MSDEKERKLTHGFEIDAGDHHHALSYMENHMNKEQVKEMVHNARESGDHNSHFTAHVDGRDIEYKLEHHDGKLRINSVHHS